MRGIESAWLRLKLWLRPALLRNDSVVLDLKELSDHERRDIGLPEPLRYMDWRALKDQK
ncbi:hypothetical protein [Microvirga soli]|uniref:hypothetical protein n=1 Tax=Microvirga soli TaxID=1854496 RepID=UPI00191CEA09|nr:hypothetical protein [Microvirga soli]